MKLQIFKEKYKKRSEYVTDNPFKIIDLYNARNHITNYEYDLITRGTCISPNIEKSYYKILDILSEVNLGASMKYLNFISYDKCFYKKITPELFINRCNELYVRFYDKKFFDSCRYKIRCSEKTVDDREFIGNLFRYIINDEGKCRLDGKGHYTNLFNREIFSTIYLTLKAGLL